MTTTRQAVREQTCRRCGRTFDDLDFLTPPCVPVGWEFGRGRCATCWVREGRPTLAPRPDDLPPAE